MFKEHDCVALTADIEEKGLKSGAGGTIVHIYPGGEVFVVEFISPDGYTADIVDVPASQVLPATIQDVTYTSRVEEKRRREQCFRQTP